MMKSVYRASLRAALCAGLSLCAGGARGNTTYYVSASGSDDNPGTQAEPFKTLGAALAVTSKGDKVKITGLLSDKFQCTATGVEIYGESRSESGLSSTSENCYLKLEDGAFVHDIKIGRSRNTGGILRMADDTCIVSNCWITGNWYTTGGNSAGVISAGLVTHCLFSGNYNDNSSTKSAVSTTLLLSGTAVMRNSVITENHVGKKNGNYGGPLNGVMELSGNAAMENCVVYGNYTKASKTGDARSASYRPRRGGGVYISGGAPTIRNCIFRNNLKPRTPSDGKYPTETGEDIYTATIDGDLYIAAAATPTIEGCNFPEGQVPESAVGCQTGLPLFVDAANRNFALQEGSPCIDAGIYQAWHLTGTDYTGAARLQGGSVDIGAVEFTAGTPQLVITPATPVYAGAQQITLTAGSGNDTPFSPATTYLWTIDGVEQEETSATFSSYFEPGSYQVTATSRNCGLFSALLAFEVSELHGVDFSVEETPGVGRASATFTPAGSGGFEIDAAATYEWYVNDETGEGEPVSTERAPTIEFGAPGTYSVLLRVLNADGAGATCEKYRSACVTVETPVFDIALSDTSGEGRTAVTLTATVGGFEPHAAATYEWRWTDLGSETPDLTGATGTGLFYPGTWSVRCILKNADGAGLALTNTLVDAVTVAPGADFYVASTGDDTGFGTKKAPYATIGKALASATRGQKIKIEGMLTAKFACTASGVEIYGDGPTQSGFSSTAQSCYLILKDGALVRDVKIGSSRNSGGVLRMSDDTCVVSNCWISDNWFTTSGNPGGDIAAGLVTHTLFSGNRCNYGPVVNVRGSAKVRNCVFTANRINNGVVNDRTGVIHLGGSALFENNTVWGNYTDYTTNSEPHSAGIYISAGSPTVRNNIVRHNFTGGGFSGGLPVAGAVERNYLCAAGATPVVTHNASSEGFGEKAVTADPLFAALDMTMTSTARDFTLGDASPCRDRGAPADWLAGATDYAGNPRVSGWAVDLGAVETPAATPVFDFAVGASVVTGAQSVAFTVTGDTDVIPADAEIRWFVDGEEAVARGLSVRLPLEEGRHDVAVVLGGFFRVEKPDCVSVKTPETVVIATEEVQGDGRKTVTFTAVARGFTFAADAAFAWYWNATGEGEPGATGNPVVHTFRSGTHDVFLRVTNHDGAGGEFVTNRLAAVTVPPMTASIRLSGTIGEGTKNVVLTAVPDGFSINRDAVCTWTWTRAEDGATGTLTGNPASAVFTSGTYGFALAIANADGEGAVVEASLPDALRVYAAQEPAIPSGQGSTPVYLDQLGDLPFKTINGRPLFGAGEMTVTSADSYRAVEDVADYGAVGDGKTDDTAAIMAALDAAYRSGKPLYFPKNGEGSVYLTRKGIVLLSGLTVTSDPGVTLASASAVLDGGGKTISTRLMELSPKGATSCRVESVSGLVPGQEITIFNKSVDESSYRETLADITAVDPETKTVTFDTSRFTASGLNEGNLYDRPAGYCFIHTDFSLVKSLRTKPAVNCTVENLTLRPYGNPLDPYIYTISPLHQANQIRAQNTLRVRNVTIDGSAHDGISAQGSGDIWIENCVVRDVKHKGIHWGTSCDRITVRGNLCLRCGSPAAEAVSDNGGTGAMYFCVNNHRVVIEGNRMVDCYRGVFGFDWRGTGENDSDSLIADNLFENCYLSGVSPEGVSGTGLNLKIAGNRFRGFTGGAVPILFDADPGLAGAVISGNVIGGFADGYTNARGAIAIANASGVVIRGNVIERNPSASGSTDIVIKESKNVAVSANVVDGAIDDGDAANENVVKTANVEINGEVKQ